MITNNICIIDRDRHCNAHILCNDLREMNFNVEIADKSRNTIDMHAIELVSGEMPEKLPNRPVVFMDDPLISCVEQTMRTIPFDFESLPLVAEGDSKIVRRLNDQLVVEKFKPSVYSYTKNRYGNVDGTNNVRAKFSAEIFRRMKKSQDNDIRNNAFVALIEADKEFLTVQRYVESCNLEVRVKRFHIGSPLHRYLYTEKYSTTQTCGPLNRWSRFDTPVVCFDWRHPLTDYNGNRLADEPISDDYAAVWMEDVPIAKKLARNAFLFMEQLLFEAGLQLVDICFFIDRTGRILFGEISPDCMRVRNIATNLDQADIFDKDIWRNGYSADTLKHNYDVLLKRIFSLKEQPAAIEAMGA